MFKRMKTHPRYIIELNEDAKIMYCEPNGTYTEADGVSSILAYNEVVGLINPSETTLIIECGGLDTQTQNLAILLKNCFEMYILTGFKEIFLVESKDITATMQMKRIARTVSDDLKFIKEFNRVKFAK